MTAYGPLIPRLETPQIPEVAFTGDTSGALFEDPDAPADLYRAKLLIVELTFVDETVSWEQVGLGVGTCNSLGPGCKRRSLTNWCSFARPARTFRALQFAARPHKPPYPAAPLAPCTQAHNPLNHLTRPGARARPHARGRPGRARPQVPQRGHPPHTLQRQVGGGRCLAS